jgi:hypothetical protein
VTQILKYLVNPRKERMSLFGFGRGIWSIAVFLFKVFDNIPELIKIPSMSMRLK